MADLSVDLAGIKMKNPVMVASGTFGSGKEYKNYVKLNKLGAIVTKGITMKAKAGNPTPRICETPSGILNSIGLQNKGVEHFIREELPWLREVNTPVIANIAGDTMDEYVEVVKALGVGSGLSGLEVNVSCPNVEKGGMSFGKDAKSCASLIKKVKAATDLPVIVKLTPNVSDVAAIAKSCEKAGADCISLVNTFLAMAIDVQTRRPKLAKGVGGLSGPAIKPIALRMVWEVFSSVKVPIIGMGGIMNAEDAYEFHLAGATAVSVGTANFINPKVSIEIIDGIKDILKTQKAKSIREIIGKVEV